MIRKCQSLSFVFSQRSANLVSVGSEFLRNRFNVKIGKIAQ